MAFDVVRAGLFFERHIDALGKRLIALFVYLLEFRFGCAFSQRACPIPGESQPEFVTIAHPARPFSRRGKALNGRVVTDCVSYTSRE
jgi:hypothetical protein